MNSLLMEEASLAQTQAEQDTSVFTMLPGHLRFEVFGSLTEESSALIDIQRGVSGDYRIASVETGSPLTVSVFDLSGRRIWNSSSSTGEVLWSRCSSSGSIVPAGVYPIMVEPDDSATFTAKVVVR